VVITFAAKSATISSTQIKLLRAKLDQLQTAASITISGYAQGSKATGALVKLAAARAQSVAAQLTTDGLTSDVQFGKSGLYKIAPTSTKANRVEIAFTPGSRLLWSQDFAGSRGDTFSREFFTGLVGDGSDQLGLPTYGTGEVEQNDPSAAALDGAGNLVIHSSVKNRIWKSERIWTAQKLAFQYGKLEIRAKFPDGSFNWPAIWMLGNNYSPPNRAFGTTQWPESGELDIAEGLAGNSVDQGTIHGLDSLGGDWRGGAGVTAVAPLANISDVFHVWGIEWKPNLVIFTLDGTEFARDSYAFGIITQTLANGSTSQFDSGGNWPFNQPFLLILNNAIPAGTNMPEGTSSDFKIDYIHYSTFEGFGQLVRQ